MGGSKSSPAPQQYYQPPAAPTATETTKQYLESMPLQYQMQQEYGQKFNQLDYEALQQFAPLVNDLMAQEQQRLSPNQYALNESLAGQALTGSTAQLPKLMQDAYTQNLRSEIDPNVGSPIGGDYVSRNLAQLGEQYRQNYQNLGLSMLNKFNTTAQTPNLASPAKSDYSLGSSSNNQMQGYNTYSQALGNSYYQAAPKQGFNYSGLIGGLASGAGMAMMCWVASEIFGGWNEPKTEACRYWISEHAPKWFKNFYYKHGEKIAKFISNKPIFKAMLRPLFEVFAFLGEEKAVSLSVGV